MAETQQLQIRTAVRTDATTLHELHRASVTGLCTSHYSLALIERWLANRTAQGYVDAIDRGEMFVCEVGGTVVGFGQAAPGEIEAIFVHPQWAGRGVGSLLLAHGLAQAQGGQPCVRLVATLNAQTFYERHGFQAQRWFSVRRGEVEVPVVEMALACPEG
jgi:GNAT superfamily N-acetyltransferase